VKQLAQWTGTGNVDPTRELFPLTLPRSTPEWFGCLPLNGLAAVLESISAMPGACGHTPSFGLPRPNLWKAQRFINKKTEVWATDSIPAPKPAARPHLRVAAIVRSTAVDHHGANRKIMKAPAVRRNDQRWQRKGYQQCPQQGSRQTERLRI
jgi:hypothetical protein